MITIYTGYPEELSMLRRRIYAVATIQRAFHFRVCGKGIKG